MKPGIGLNRWKRSCALKIIIACIVTCSRMLYMILELNKKFKESYDEDRSD